MTGALNWPLHFLVYDLCRTDGPYMRTKCSRIETTCSPPQISDCLMQHQLFFRKQVADMMCIKVPNSKEMHQPRIELGAQRWQRWILPLNHWCCKADNAIIYRSYTCIRAEAGFVLVAQSGGVRTVLVGSLRYGTLRSLDAGRSQHHCHS
jgi:hypothetical protein